MNGVVVVAQNVEFPNIWYLKYHTSAIRPAAIEKKKTHATNSATSPAIALSSFESTTETCSGRRRNVKNDTKVNTTVVHIDIDISISMQSGTEVVRCSQINGLIQSGDLQLYDTIHVDQFSSRHLDKVYVAKKDAHGVRRVVRILESDSNDGNSDDRMWPAGAVTASVTWAIVTWRRRVVLVLEGGTLFSYRGCWYIPSSEIRVGLHVDFRIPRRIPVWWSSTANSVVDGVALGLLGPFVSPLKIVCCCLGFCTVAMNRRVLTGIHKVRDMRRYGQTLVRWAYYACLTGCTASRVRSLMYET